jgi:hypothetical protein
MPTEETESKPVAEKTTPQPEGVKPEGSAVQQPQTPADFDAWLAAQPDEIKTLYESHTAGLKSALDKERRANKKRDDEAANAAKAAQDAQLSEVDKATKQAEQLKQERDSLAQQLRLINAREALIIAAEKQKVEFASAQAQRDALDIALKDAEFDDDGRLTGAEALLKSALKDRDYLIKRQPTVPAGATNAAERGSSTTPVMTDEERREVALRIGIDPRYLTPAMLKQ